MPAEIDPISSNYFNDWQNKLLAAIDLLSTIDGYFVQPNQNFIELNISEHPLLKKFIIQSLLTNRFYITFYLKSNIIYINSHEDLEEYTKDEYIPDLIYVCFD
jgi:hypothetical protein